MQHSHKKLTFLALAQAVLEESKIPLNAGQIWEEAQAKGLDKELGSIGKTPRRTLEARLYTDIKSEDSPFIFASKKPTTLWLKSRESELDKPHIEEQILESEKVSMQKSKFKERDLHPLLVKYLSENEHFRLYCKTIRHETSKKSQSGQDKWNYPDIVGIHFAFSDDYESETLELLDAIGYSNYKLCSFELKIALNFSNLKESYFQAVSNSSWANEGYLVVFEEIDDEILTELRRLNTSFGIGVIQLTSDIVSSKILLSSQSRDIDSETLNMLVSKNPNFRDFVDSVVKDIDIRDEKRIVKDSYDEILNDKELEKYLKDKK
ncbi:HrgA protein [Helicobacter monodelphidis]|uniref:HTH domain-containing protein n=1 Tax=Helicobacter sp. 15-1451 TaxID=2004995 RepID=UPI000DCE17A5|nr:HTH domain-containing protein [Helicobacter sp. 15-1451]RAX57420.1 HrgA protein [Helicobacter sp. 15-1451]